MAKKWHNKHISTKWGLAILGFLLVSLILLIPVLGQNQDQRTEAAATLSCGGGSSCLDASVCNRAGVRLSQVKSGKSDRCHRTYGAAQNVTIGVCCFYAKSCESKRGKCVKAADYQQRVKQKLGTFVDGLCPGATSGVKCYVPRYGSPMRYKQPI